MLLSPVPLFPTGPKPFKFFNAWTKYDSFLPIVRSSWEKDVSGTAMFRLASKLKRVKIALKIWSKEILGPIQNCLMNQRTTLEAVQAQLQLDPLNKDLIFLEYKERVTYKDLLLKEESMIRQKSRQNWLRLGDCNSAYFYASFAGRKAQNTLRRVTLQDGTVTDDPASVKARIVEFYTELHNTPLTTPKYSPMDFKSKLSGTDAQQLLKEQLLEDFAHCSGLHLNPEKSQVFLSSSFSDACSFLDLVGIAVGTLPVRYLGLPLIDRSLTHSACLPLLDKLRKRFAGWKGHLLTFAGRVELAKTVLNSLQIFWSAAFLLPQNTIKHIEKLIRSFIWGDLV
ncbi:hypothetical protein QJS10_CPB12g00823 [Acorus calamus]|uniref:Reverse transcriptase n=1 Tax=Acorus calamus TaxID=4465 RepID=A0AAV9DR39_ACOCL|nr:hypothetical protein QJS10_CPB12g00823 [Acorus calamus]